jgi:hypothetical protein
MRISGRRSQEISTGTRLGSLLFCLGSLLALAPASLWSQTILVQVLASESREPIPTAFVSLLDEGGIPIRHALTNTQGRALFPLGEAGPYQLRAQMFGRETAWSPPIRVNADTTASYLFTLAVEAIPLPGIRVESERQCRIRPQDGRELARVWAEAGKALNIQNWTEEEELYLFRMVEWERDLDRQGRNVESETRQESATTSRNPISSLPAEDLMSGGFIRSLEDGRNVFFGPDASVLLSDPFLDSHCFRLVEDEDQPGAIGLAFEPVGDQGMADVEGTLWLDRETAHLKFLEFGYTNVANRITQGVARGRVEFERLPEGAWIIRRFWIQVPNLTSRIGRTRLAGIHETGGEVTEIIPLSEDLPFNPGVPGSLGMAWDSTRFAPLADLCDLQETPPSSSPLVGRVQAAPMGEPIPGARVLLRWGPDNSPGSVGLGAALEELQTFTDSEGLYGFCGVPTDRSVTAQAFFQGQESAPATIRLEEGAFAVLMLTIEITPADPKEGISKGLREAGRPGADGGGGGGLLPGVP